MQKARTLAGLHGVVCLHTIEPPCLDRLLLRYFNPYALAREDCCSMSVYQLTPIVT